ncbi:MAG: ABC-F family ATP-binding cassette domain-containing protein [Alloprevotella sp.]|nr:ABC-F family ATP-binding cassette domain-containing protein [Alloprevotella sp.]
MISANNLSVEFSARPLFSGVSFVINPRERIALVGKNGAGKSTLLKILAGQQTPTAGLLSVERGISVGYLPQVMPLSDTCSVREEAEKAFSSIQELQQSVARMEADLAEMSANADSPDYLALVEKFSHASERLQMMGGLNYHARLERTLLGLGFSRDDLDRSTSEFSGGWRMRVELAKLLLQAPDVLLLDEPTNHLDIESIRWLETFLARSSGAAVIVSHDRAFLNNVTSRTMEISCGILTDYRVKYDDYVRLRADRREQQLRAYQNQQKEIAEIKDFIERFRYKPTKAVQVQSRIKQLEKIVPIEVDAVDTSSLHLKFPPCERSGDFPVICDGVGKDYGAHRVFSGVDMTIRRGEKIAFVGKNGEGKTTLVKCIMQEIPYQGTLKIGHNVRIGYYAQNQAQLLDGELTVFDSVDRVATGDVRLRLRDILGAFMFGGAESEKKVKVLSGGERSRLAMIKLLLEPVNLLILDEPTNHLDMRTKDVLKEALLAFDGTVILVSHDRDFLDGLAEKVYEFGGGRVREHIGGIYDFLWKKDIDSLDELHLSASQHVTSSKPVSEGGGGRLTYEQQKERAKLLRRAEKGVAQCEADIARLEEKIASIEARLSTPEGAADAALATEYAASQKELELAMEAWEAAENHLAALSEEHL